MATLPLRVRRRIEETRAAAVRRLEAEATVGRSDMSLSLLRACVVTATFCAGLGFGPASASPEDTSRCVVLGQSPTAEMMSFIEDAPLSPQVSCSRASCRVTIRVAGENGRDVDLGVFDRRKGDSQLCFDMPTRSGLGFDQAGNGTPPSECSTRYSLVRISVRVPGSADDAAFVDALYRREKSSVTPTKCMDEGYNVHHRTSLTWMRSSSPTYQFATDRAAIRHSVPPHGD